MERELRSGEVPACADAPRASLSDADLVRATLEGDREAFGELAGRYGPKLLGYLRRLTHNADEAEDLAQEALLRAYRSLEDFQQDRPFSPWIFRIATNLAMDVLRRRGRAVSFEDLEDRGTGIPDQTRSPVPQRLDSHRLSERMEEALRSLPPATAALLELRYSEGMQVQDIAESLGKRPGAVAVMIHRARQKLRAIVFGDEGAQASGEGDNTDEM